MTSTGRAIYDELLVLRCRRGDRDAWRQLLERWEMPLFFYIRRLIPREQDAWDVLQQTWLAVLRGLPKLREPKGFAVWAHRIARNLAISHRRGEESIDALPEDVAHDKFDDPSADAMLLEDAEQVHRALDRLSLPHREVLTLHFLQDLSLEQIAEVVDAPVGTIKSRLHYAKLAMRSIIGKETES